MNLGRRRFLQLAAGASLSPARASRARADTYPSRPVRLIVGSTPGAAPDVVARLIAQALSERLGQAFVVENRAGASGNLAAEIVARAAPDGYTLLLSSASDAINASLYSDLKFNFIRDIAAVGGVVSFPMVITVRSALATKTLPELIADAKARPGKINIGTPPIGSPQHVAGELFKMLTDTEIVMVAYRGGPAAITDALGGQIDGVIGTVLLLIDFIRNGNLRALAVTGSTPSELLPDVPTVASVVPNFEASQWTGVAAPANTPAPIVERLNQAINAGLADPQVKQRLVELGGTPLPGSAQAFGAFIAAETAKWGKVVKFANLKPE
ncbi:MAG TPA: tripartite tricarboxylate transporter substrate binding protein [Xanthobacteraceae bacterium]|nr:tripartite tricarboxylate transporter substrate binding protein [Xanthobacteraceae bacterium]